MDSSLHMGMLYCMAQSASGPHRLLLHRAVEIGCIYLSHGGREVSGRNKGQMIYFGSQFQRVWFMVDQLYVLEQSIMGECR